MDGNKVDVSVIMTTYGHEEFIIEAIEGVLKQDFTGTIELIISNDKSPDNTDHIIFNFLKTYQIPENINIRYFLQEINLGAVNNFLWCINEAKGKYLALCEGDDYWTDSRKITRQVEFLNKHIDYSIIFTNVIVQIENGEYNQCNELTPVVWDREYHGHEIIENWVAHTSTYLIRNEQRLKDFGDFFREHNFMYGDTPLFLYSLKFGKGFGIKEYTSTYRRHAGGLTNQVQNNDFYLRFVSHLESMYDAFDVKEYRKELKKGIIGFYLRLFLSKDASFPLKVKYFSKAMKYDKFLLLNILKDKVNQI